MSDNILQTVAIVYAVRLEKRPKIQGLFGALFGLASIVGPLIGGGFTSNLTWRWCFYINIPFGVVALATIAVCLKVPSRNTTRLSWKEKLSQLDAVGSTLLLPGVVCLLLALQWGGQTYAVSQLEYFSLDGGTNTAQWSNARIIALLTIMAVLLVTFVSTQFLRPKTALIPPHILRQRSVVSGFWSTICVGSSQYIYGRNLLCSIMIIL